NQIEKAYGPNNSILDNCHVRVAFATNDERTAKRISDALGSTTEMRAMRNYAGHRLAPWLAHVMVSRQETARQLMTPGEVMQMPADEEVVLISGMPPTRANKIRYYQDKNFSRRVAPPPVLNGPGRPYGDVPPPRQDDWGRRTAKVDNRLYKATSDAQSKASDNGGKERQPAQPEHAHGPKRSNVQDNALDHDIDGQADIGLQPSLPKTVFGIGQDSPGIDLKGIR
ncbi:MAG: type IV secretory system conjugative DNA transfer family protein, partial [Pseudomonadota bacterium]